MSSTLFCGGGGVARPSVSPVLYRLQASRLVFKRRLYQDLDSEDKLAQKLLYYQTLVSICDESLPTLEKQLLRFLALHRIIDEKLKPEPIGVPYVAHFSLSRSLCLFALFFFLSASHLFHQSYPSLCWCWCVL